jgi:hypothetical protein
MHKVQNHFILSNILHSAQHRLTFISNPKVACSTIKNSMLGGFSGNVHLEAKNRFNLPKDIEHDFFCLTRNPYSRALSCFKNKIGPSKEKNPNAVWLPFCKRFRFNENYQPTFEEFLNALADDQDQRSMDMHYRCQHFNLHYENIRPAFVGRLERFRDISEFLTGFNIQIIERNNHVTGAFASYQKEISQLEAKLIEKIYKKDFEFYGYEKDIYSNYRPPTLKQKQNISNAYKQIFMSNYEAM